MSCTLLKKTFNFILEYSRLTGFPGGASGKKNPPANAGDIRDVGSVPALGRSPEECLATHSNILAWRIPWAEEPGRLQSIGLQSQTRLKRLRQIQAQQINNVVIVSGG